MASKLATFAVLLVAASSLALPPAANGANGANEGLVGASVGNADTFISEGTKLFNQKKYNKAAENFLKATRANPSTLNTYLQYARAAMLDKQVVKACYAYRVYLKASPDTPDRKKAAAESESCERQAKTVKNSPDVTQRYVENRAAFFAALDKNELLTASGAADSLRDLVHDGFMGPELSDMATKLGNAAVTEADSVHKRALAQERLPSETLRSARPLYQLATEVGLSPADSKARMAFLDGLAALYDKDWRKADGLFSDAMKADPNNHEYAYYKGLALFQAGDRAGALRALETDLKDDPRTGVLRVAHALGNSPEAGAAELEKLLFTTRYPPEK